MAEAITLALAPSTPTPGQQQAWGLGELSGYDCGQEEACSQDVTISSVVSKRFWGREISGCWGGSCNCPRSLPWMLGT